MLQIALLAGVLFWTSLAHAGTLTITTTPAEDAALQAELTAAGDQRTPSQYVETAVRAQIQAAIAAGQAKRLRETMQALEAADPSTKAQIRQLLRLAP